MGTRMISSFESFPYLAVLSPVKRCGKTRVLEVLEPLVHEPVRGVALTSAVLFRILDLKKPTLLWDEAEPLNAKNKSESTQDILAILNVGYKKGGKVFRCEGQQHDPREFEVYGAKVFAVIGRLPDTVADRGIVINMQRKAATQKIARFLAVRAAAEAKPIREDISRFIASRREVIVQAYMKLMDEDLEFLASDRDAELWIPLFAVCSVAATDRLAELRESAIALSGVKAGGDVDDSQPMKLLADINTVWPKDQAGLPVPSIDTASLIEELKKLEESPWGEYGLPPRKVAKMLRPFGIEARTVRIGARTPRGYDYEALRGALLRYLPDSICNSATRQ